MIFNSFVFLIFIVPVFLIYWLANNNLKIQNCIILISSYIFYGWWDWRFLSLIIISSITDYLASIYIENSDDQKKRKYLLIISLVVNLSILGFFKYYNFFIDSLELVFSNIGFDLSNAHLGIVLPVGISFYTFQSMGYTIDVYKKRIKASRDIVSFFAYISFFPQLVAGPIERAKNFLPQFQKKRIFDESLAYDGIQRIVWGLFKKTVIADNAAYYVNDIFNNYYDQNQITLLIGACYFAIQVYCDFSGYSDIAIG